MGQFSRFAGAGLAALVLAMVPGSPADRAAGAAFAQDGAGILGTWHRSARPGGVRLTDSAHATFLGRTEWVEDASACTDRFVHDFETVNADELFSRLTANETLDNDGVPISSALQGRLPEGSVPTLTASCCCISEISAHTTYALVAPNRMIAVIFADGIYAIDDLQREAPLVPPQSLDQQTRESIQRALLARGYYDDDIDGLFGGGTRAAISDFQASLGHEETGILNRYQIDILLSN